MRGSRGGGEVSPDPLENHEAIGFLNNAGPEPLKKKQSYQASIQCLAIIGPPAKRHVALRRRAEDGPLIVAFGSLYSVINYKKLLELDPL